ncbi:MAG: hypothetical protein JSS55_04075 [Proteobacteria bacterium]|nr:hypothetical protein [Pseudomonadota bacterium]
MRRLLCVSLALATLATPLTAAAAQRWHQGWRVIGFKTVGMGTDRDTIRVRGNERFRQVRLCSYNRPIRLLDFGVRFANGGRQDLQVRNRIAPNSCTRAIDLRGQARNIDQVELTYERIDRRLGAPLIRVSAR